MYATTAAGTGAVTGATAAIVPVAGHPSGLAGGVLAFTGPAFPYLQALMIALLVISLGLMMVHASRLRRGQSVTGAAIFKH